MQKLSLALSVALVLAMAGTSRAAEKPRPTQANEKQPKKVWTNEDLEQLRSRGLISVVGQEAPAQAAPAAQATEAPELTTFRVFESRLDDPVWYAQQADQLQTALDCATAALQQEQDSLAAAKDRNSAPGVALDKPSVGVTPEAALALLQAQVDQIQMQLDALSDLARQHDIPPGAMRG